MCQRLREASLKKGTYKFFLIVKQSDVRQCTYGSNETTTSAISKKNGILPQGTPQVVKLPKQYLLLVNF